MTRTLQTALALTVALAGFTGCDDGDTAPSIPLEALPEAIGDAACEPLLNCLGDAAPFVYRGGEDCQTIQTGRWATRVPAIQGHLADGTATYDDAAAGRCVEAVRDRTCTELDTRQWDACDEAIAGQVEPDGTCTDDTQCAGNTYCDFDTGCPGVCTRRGQAGTECARDNECESGFVCSAVTSLCVAPATDGEPCGGGVEKQCATGLVCIGADGGVAGTCRDVSAILVQAEGEACSGEELCLPGLVCALAGNLTDPATCQPKVGSGEACKVATPNQCPDGEYCNVDLLAGTSTCATLPGEGETCAPFAGCGPYLRCDAGTCRGLRDVGESCSRDELCWSNNCVNGGCRPAGACQ